MSFRFRLRPAAIATAAVVALGAGIPTAFALTADNAPQQGVEVESVRQATPPVDQTGQDDNQADHDDAAEAHAESGTPTATQSGSDSDHEFDGEEQGSCGDADPAEPCISGPDAASDDGHDDEKDAANQEGAEGAEANHDTKDQRGDHQD